MAKPPEAEPKDAKDRDGKDAAGPAKGGRKKLILMAAPVLLALIGAGLWFGGIVPHGAPKPVDSKAAAAALQAPVIVDVPELMANLNVSSRHSTFVKLHAKLTVAASDQAAVAAAMPRIEDLFTTFLRETRPEELRGAIGTTLLREAMIDRADAALAPVRVRDVLFVEMLVQ